MDVDQVADALKRLKKRQDVDIPFDPGDEEPARGMMKRLAALGLESNLIDDTSPVGVGLPSWFIKYIGGGCAGLLLLWTAAVLLPTGSGFRKFMPAMTALFVVSIPIAYRLYLDSLTTQEAREDRDRRERQYLPWLIGAVIVFAFTAHTPWLGLLFLAIGVGGIGCAMVIRLMTRKSERRIEVLEQFSPNEKVDHQHAPTADRR
jgi:predicted lysophospholipase L1 biosynthesis ABC-type transport system permease subunit